MQKAVCFVREHMFWRAALQRVQLNQLKKKNKTLICKQQLDTE